MSSTGGLCIVVPYRNRLNHLQRFVPHILQFLPVRRPKLLVVEQGDQAPFNRGALLNIGFALARPDADYICFHDVDMLPVDDACDYRPPVHTTHLAGCVEQFGYRMPYGDYIGGVLLVRPDDFVRCNGFSNRYWGWGSEDDDLYLRLTMAGVTIGRRPGRYRSLRHTRSYRSAENSELFSRMARTAIDSGQFARDATSALEHYASAPGERAEPDRDGLNTLAIGAVSRRPLSSILSGQGLDESHEVATVTLAMD
jgi:hypothetical protein